MGSRPLPLHSAVNTPTQLHSWSKLYRRCIELAPNMRLALWPPTSAPSTHRAERQRRQSLCADYRRDCNAKVRLVFAQDRYGQCIRNTVMLGIFLGVAAGNATWDFVNSYVSPACNRLPHHSILGPWFERALIKCAHREMVRPHNADWRAGASLAIAFHPTAKAKE